MSGVRHFTVEEDDDGQRLDRWIKRHVPEIPYGLAQKLMRKGQVRVDGKRAKAETRLKAGQDVRIPPVMDKEDKKKKVQVKFADAEFIKSLVIFEDADIIAINKPQGIATQGGKNIEYHIDGLLDVLTDRKGVRPRLVHRLDRETSGVLLLARSAKVARTMGKIFAGRGIKKIYWALVSPVPEILEGTIKAPLIKGEGARKDCMVIDEEKGKYAATEYKIIDQLEKRAAFAVFWPRTGRTHQIRVHAADAMGCPIVGDEKYGARKIKDFDLSPRLHLHAARIICPHPSGKGKLDISAALPPELVKSWKALGFDTKLKEDPFVDIAP